MDWSNFDNKNPFEIFRTVFGSHLYGTHGPNSDRDYKGIFITDFHSMLSGIEKETLHFNTKSPFSGSRNGAEDVDIELIELRKFINDACEGQTYALDMLYAPDYLWKTSSPIWEHIVKNRDRFLSKKIGSFMAYAMRQASKYGIKGSRLAAVRACIEWAELKSGEIRDHIDTLPRVEHVELISKDSQVFVKILEKHFPMGSQIKDLHRSLTATFNRSGGRAVQAMENDGVDWKAISHAFRASYQTMEIICDGKISFPLDPSYQIREIKEGKHTWEDISPHLSQVIALANTTLATSDLPDKPQYKFWNKFLLDLYPKAYAMDSLRPRWDVSQYRPSETSCGRKAQEL